MAKIGRKPRQFDHPQELRDAIYRKLPKPDYLRLSGMSTSVLHDQADRWGLPLRGSDIDLFDLVPKLHRVITRIARSKVLDPAAVRNGDDSSGGDALLGGSASPALEQYRSEKARLERIKRMQAEAEVIMVDELSSTFARMAAVLRSASEQLQRQFGEDAARVLADAIGSVEAEIGIVNGDIERRKRTSKGLTADGSDGE